MKTKPMTRPVALRLQGAIVLVCAVGIGACTPSESQRHTDVNDFGSATKAIDYGGNPVSGSASLVSRSGYVRTCDGNVVYLIPITTDSTNLMIELFGKPSGGIGQRFKLEHQPKAILNSGKQVECGGDGTFKFEHVADGTYYVVTDVTWLLRLTPEGAALGGIVRAGGGQPIEVELQHQY